ncbi:MAG: hypothetical protein JST06_05980 [Bacteroidetes bacterium]|nr:hypothetical protein [Bacteroidota bacterium]
MTLPQVKPRLRDYTLLALLLALVFWPLSSFHHTLRWDALEGYFPFRYFLSDSIRQGILPLWNPYQLGGYPFYGDPQSGFWYPVAWLFGSVSSYSLSLFSVVFLFHIVLAAWGTYELTLSFDTGRPVALIAAISFAASGFFVGNAEHITWVVSAAWLPWAFWSFRNVLLRASLGDALLLPCFLYLMLSGGYPAFFIVTVYVLIACTLCWLGFMARKQSWKRRLVLLFVAAVLLLGLSAGALLSWMQALPYSTRSGAMTAAQYNLYPFPPRALISLLLPFATLKDDVFFATDVVMRNAYFGLLCLLALPFAWPALRHNKQVLLVAVLALAALALSLGDKLPLRGWLAEWLPGMDRFRFPALFRVFFILGLIVVSAQGLQRLISNFPARRKAFVALILGLMLVLAGLLSYSILRHGGHWGWGFLGSRFETYQHQSSRDENLQLQAITQLILLGGLLWLCLWRRGQLIKPASLLFFCVADMSLALSMNAFSTLVYEERASNIATRIAQSPHQFPVPDLRQAILNHSDVKRNLGELRTNTGIYFKTPQADGYNSFLLRNFAYLDANAIADSVRSNPVAYFAWAVQVAPDSVRLPTRHWARVNAQAAQKLYGIHLAQKGTIACLQFDPQILVFQTHTSETALFCLQQNRFPGWKLFVDGKPAKIMDLNRAQMGALLPAGAHELQWRFEPYGIRLMLYVTWILGGLLLLSLLVFRKRLFGGNRSV